MHMEEQAPPWNQALLLSLHQGLSVVQSRQRAQLLGVLRRRVKRRRGLSWLQSTQGMGRGQRRRGRREGQVQGPSSRASFWRKGRQRGSR